MDAKNLRGTALAKVSSKVDPEGVLTADDHDHFRKLFDNLDANSDGWISREELRLLYTTEAEVDQALKIGDLDGDGGLSFDELIIVSAEQKLEGLEEQAWRIFAGFDVDGDGTVERGELEALTDAGAQEAAAWLTAAFGSSGDELSYLQFLTWYVNRELAALP